MSDFIFELGCEELPSGLVLPLSEEFASTMLAALDKAQLTYGMVKRFATPRRFALLVCDLQSEQSSQQVTRRGPAVAAAFDSEGNATPALCGFAKSCGVPLDALKKIHTDKGEWMVYETETSGVKTRALLPGLVQQALASLTITKPMRWGSGDDEFARPVHWALALYGNELVDFEVFGIKTSRNSRGHRFHHSEEFVVTSPQSYEEQLRAAFVVADFLERKQLIQTQIAALAARIGANAIVPEDLLTEVTSIVEWPESLLACFDKAFLDVPAEALVAAMQVHQKCFALQDADGKLLPNFITVANIASSNPDQVISGNEKVMRARLSDAAFFFHQDKKTRLEQYIPATKQVIFQEKLGSLYDKTQRINALLTHIAQAFNLPAEQAERAAALCKCDLLTGMVGEFPELQGLMGYYYGLNDGENPSVAEAIQAHYLPRFAADALPATDLGKALSLADRIDTLTGIFAIGQKPSGVKDPFKLRRHALAVVRLLISTPVMLNLSSLIEESLANYSQNTALKAEFVQELKPFILERLVSWYQSAGISADIVQAARARQDEWLFDLDQRIQALKHFVTMPEASALSAACKRVNNILSQTQQDSGGEIDESLLSEGAERALYEKINATSKLADSLYVQGDYASLLKQLAELRTAIDSFFDNVMVLVDDSALRKNRLALLQRMQSLLQGVADISLLQCS